MTIQFPSKLALVCFSLMLLLVACDSGTQTASPAVEPDTPDSLDDRIQSQVEAVIASASDLPTGLSIEVSQGVVSVSGSLDCENCGGMRTPNTVGTIQQSLGAMVRAVPGVTGVEFSLSSDS
jgi:hypothetical protein